jgi:hypothetical protein
VPPVRRLTAILAADVAGYSRLMGVNEEGTHERLKAHLGELIEPKIREHHGRIVKNTGDGFLAEFASVVDAVRCAVEMQRAGRRWSRWLRSQSVQVPEMLNRPTSREGVCDVCQVVTKWGGRVIESRVRTIPFGGLIIPG